MRPELKRAFLRIVNAIACTDGGLELVNFQSLLESLDAQAANGDTAAETILEQVHVFSRLIDAAQPNRVQK